MGIIVTFLHDAQGRMISASRYRVSAGIGGEETVTTRYTYDSYGRQSTIDYGTHKVSFTYDLNDNVLSETRLSNDGTVENTTSYTYDENGNVLTVTRNGETITYVYDEDGNRIQMSYGGLSQYMAYDDEGKLQSLNNTTYLPSGDKVYNARSHYYIDGRLTTANEVRDKIVSTNKTYSYDDEGNLTVINHTNNAMDRTETHLITYDDEGRIVSENTTEFCNGNNTISKSYTYDWLGRLETETVDGVVTTYTYDNVGNLLEKTTDGVETKYTYTDFDQVERVITDGVIESSYTYDISGNRASKTSYGATATYNYDGQNCLTQIIAGQYTSAWYTYDARGERLSKLNSTHMTNYYYDGVNLLFTKYDDTIDVIYMYADDQIFGAIEADRETYWYSTDVRGSVTKVMKMAGNGSASTSLEINYGYNAYGKTDVATTVGSTFRNHIAYTGAIIDHESGLYYLMSRYYDPALAQFISEDSYRGEGEAFWHLYKYCDNDPINKTDRNGKYGLWYPSKNKINKYGTKGPGAAMPFIFYKINYPNANCMGFALGFNRNVKITQLMSYSKKQFKNDDRYNVERWFTATVGFLKTNKRYIRRITGPKAKILPNERRVALRCVKVTVNNKVGTGMYTEPDYHYMLQFNNGKWGGKFGETKQYESNVSSTYGLWYDKKYNSKIIYFAISTYKYKG